MSGIRVTSWCRAPGRSNGAGALCHAPSYLKSTAWTGWCQGFVQAIAGGCPGQRPRAFASLRAMKVEIFSCDLCGRETKYVTQVTAKAIGLNRDLCSDCVDSLKHFLSGRPDPHRKTVITYETAELEDVYRKGAEALEAWAMGATADEMAQHVRDMLSRAKRESNGHSHDEPAPRTILGVAV